MRFFTRQINPRSFASWCVKGTEESSLDVVSFGLGSCKAKLQRFRPLRILSYPGRDKHQSGTNLENRTPTPETPKGHYKRISFNAIDTVMQCAASRLEQEHFKIYVNIQEILLKYFPSDALPDVVKMYSGDLDSFKLKGQLLLLPKTAESMGFDT